MTTTKPDPESTAASTDRTEKDVAAEKEPAPSSREPARQPAPRESPPVPVADAEGEDAIRMPQFQGDDAGKKRKVLKKWMRLKRKEAKRKARRERWARRWRRYGPYISAPFGSIKKIYLAILALLKAPFDALSVRLEAAREAKAEAMKEQLKSTEPAREARARARWEKKLKKEIKRDAFRERWGKRLAGLKSTLPNPVKGVKNLAKAIKNAFLAPFRGLALAREEARLRKLEKQNEALKKTAKTREAVVQRKHARLMRKEMRKRARAQRRRERWAGFRNRMQALRRLWSNLSSVRRLIYIIAAIVLIVIYRNEIAKYAGDVLGFDLQSLME